MLNVSRRGSRVSAYTRVSHSSDALLRLFLRLGRESRSLFGRGTTILCLFRSHLLFVISPPYTQLLYVYIFICTYTCMCCVCVCVWYVPPLRSSLSLAISVGRAVRAFHSSFSRFFSVFDVLLRSVPTDLRVCTIRGDPACFVDRGHTHRKDKGEKEIFF